ncbi:hypothetical protein D3C76_1063250 [compost metagenome]
MVEHGSLVIIRVSSLGIPLEHMSCQLEHIVSVTGFAGAFAKPVVQLSGIPEMLIIAVAPDDVGVVVYHAVPEVTRDFSVLRLSGHLILARGPDDFRDLRIGMTSGQGILV